MPFLYKKNFLSAEIVVSIIKFIFETPNVVLCKARNNTPACKTSNKSYVNFDVHTWRYARFIKSLFESQKSFVQSILTPLRLKQMKKYPTQRSKAGRLTAAHVRLHRAIKRPGRSVAGRPSCAARAWLGGRWPAGPAARGGCLHGRRLHSSFHSHMWSINTKKFEFINMRGLQN